MNKCIVKSQIPAYQLQHTESSACSCPHSCMGVGTGTVNLTKGIQAKACIICMHSILYRQEGLLWLQVCLDGEWMSKALSAARTTTSGALKPPSCSCGAALWSDTQDNGVSVQLPDVSVCEGTRVKQGAAWKTVSMLNESSLNKLMLQIFGFYTKSKINFPGVETRFLLTWMQFCVHLQSIFQCVDLIPALWNIFHRCRG